MSLRQKYHLEPDSGWMNDPNGLIYFKGKYHAFYQHNPTSPSWTNRQMLWGHAISDDLIHWEHLPIALYADAPYDKDGGAWSGTAIAVGDRLYLFYTSVCDELGQTQSVAWSDDGIHFVKYEGNPVILPPKETVNGDFRDPKVFKYGESYYIAVCNRVDNGKGGRILLYKSPDLLHWDSGSVLYNGEVCGEMPECADFFPLADEYVLMFSRNSHRRSTVFVRGDFDGESFTPKPDGVSFPEIGPHFYAPQTFAAPDGRRILFGWVLDRGIQAPPNQRSQSCMSLPRELSIEDGRIKSRPAREALPYLRKEKTYAGETLICYDTKSIEIFDESGENVLTLWQPDAAAAETRENAAF